MREISDLALAKKNLYEIIKSVNKNDIPIKLKGSTEDSSAVIMSVRYYKSLKETLYLMSYGTLDKVQNAIKDDSGDIDITSGINWDKV